MLRRREIVRETSRAERERERERSAGRIAAEQIGSELICAKQRREVDQCAEQKS